MAYKQHLFSLVSSQLYETYSNVCRKQQVAAVDQSECLSLSEFLEARCILELKKNKETRFTKVQPTAFNCFVLESLFYLFIF